MELRSRAASVCVRRASGICHGTNTGEIRNFTTLLNSRDPAMLLLALGMPS
jgi:hypothetical protein